MNLQGIPISDWHAESAQNELPFKALKLALIPEDRARLHKLIEQRFDQMLEQGFIARSARTVST